MPKNKRKTTISKTAQDLRTNALENGMYFYISDLFRDPDVEIANYFANCGIKMQHSNQLKNFGRSAVFLNIGTPDFTESLFPGSKRCHITFDRNYYEFEGDANPERLKWHYCHYTEEYVESGHTVHIYFNSLGQPVEYSLSHKTEQGQISRALTSNEIGLLGINISFAYDIISTLLNKKRLKIEEAAFNARRMSQEIRHDLQSIKQDKDGLELLNELYNNYDTQRKLAQRYADTLLQFSDIKLSELLTPPMPPDSTIVEDQPNTTTTLESMKDKQAAENQLTLNTLNTRIDIILAWKNIFPHITEVEQIQNKLLLIAKEVTGHQKKQAMTLLTKLDKIDLNQIIAQQLNIERVTLEYLREHFNNIESSLTDKFYLDVINKAIASKDESTRNKFLDICRFLFKYSLQYREFIKQANIITNPQENQLCITWLFDCFQKNNPAAFTMLLRHGLNLGVNAASDPKIKESVYDSAFKLLLNKFWISCIEVGDMSSNDSKVREILYRLQTFLSIMLRPEFMAGAEYEYNLRKRLSRDVIRSRLQQQIEVKRTVAESQGRLGYALNPDDLVENFGLLSILDYVINFGLPPEIVNLVAANINAEQVKLENVASNFGNIFSDHDFSILINFDKQFESKYSGKVICFPRFKLAEFSNDIGGMHDLPVTGNITPRIFITERPHGALETIEQLSRSQNILFNLNKLFTTKMQVSLAKNGPKEILHRAEKMLAIKTVDVTNQREDRLAVGRILGALLLLINIEQGKNKIEQNVLILRALLKLSQISQKSHTAVSQAYAFNAYRLYLEAKQTGNQNLFSALDVELRKFGEPNMFKEHASRYNTIPEVRIGPVQKPKLGL